MATSSTSSKREQAVQELVEHFRRNAEAYKSNAYDEANTRVDFIDSFFEVLGWDVRNTARYTEQYREVVREDLVRIRGKAKAPDYSFRIGGIRKFFVEAKKPSVNIHDDAAPAYQLRRYAYSAHLPLSILTDFEEIAVYDCRVKPKATDKSDVARIFYVTYDKLLDEFDSDRTNFDHLYGLFSKESIMRGSFEGYLEDPSLTRGTSEVDKDFLSLIGSWRERLARNIALRNESLSLPDLNHAVQKIIDRILFLRIAEDRRMEEYGRLQGCLDADQSYPALVTLFHEADEKYNSGLFDSERWLDELSVDNQVLARVLRDVYPPDCPYEFSILPVEILGAVYEQFLGETIYLTKGHKAKVAQKPEVAKAGGVYYTPQYIVDYIVDETIGSALGSANSPKGGEVRVLDPACGSGSFLVAAYSYLLRWHLRAHTANPTRIRNAIASGSLYEAGENDYRLTISEKQRILQASIFGVDLDEQAAEVTKLSLLLKLLEDESVESRGELFAHSDLKLLPDLSGNIKVGNSLIGTDFYTAKNYTFGEDYEKDRRANPFDWTDEFPAVMKAGGFDVIVGNPPYLRVQGLQQYYGEQIAYYGEKYESAVKRFDFYLLFLEQGYRLLRSGGSLGYICPHKFVNADFGSGLRSFLIAHKALKSIISFGENLVFARASTYTGLVFLTKGTCSTFSYYEFPKMSNRALRSRLTQLDTNDFSEYRPEDLDAGPWNLTRAATGDLLSKLACQPETVSSVFESVFQGIVTGADDIYFLTNVNPTSETMCRAYSARQESEIEIEKDLLVPMLKGEDVSRYEASTVQTYCIYPYKLAGEKTRILDEGELKTRYPFGYSYLKQFRKELVELRHKFKTNPAYWYSCHRSRGVKQFQAKKVITQEISLGCNMTLDTEGKYFNTTVYGLIPRPDRPERIEYWLAILNSKLMWWFMRSTGNVLRGGYYRFKTNYLKPFPIRTCNVEDPSECEIHDRTVACVERLLHLYAERKATRSRDATKSIAQRIQAIESRVDDIVYGLYGLSEAEREEVESAYPEDLR